MDAKQLYCNTRDAIIARVPLSMTGAALVALSWTVSVGLTDALVQAAEPSNPQATSPQRLSASRIRLLDEPGEQFRDESEVPFVQSKIQLISAQEDGTLVPPRPTEPGETSDEPELRAELGGTASQLRKTVPAARMTVRRDPSPKRVLASAEPGGKTIAEVQEDLKKSEETSQVPTDFTGRFADFGLVDDLPYGKYLYIHHDPLFFEDIPAERYGEVPYPCIQPVISFTKFMGTFAMIPYKVTADYCAANHEGGVYAYDHHYNLRPGVFEGSYFPSVDVMKQYPRASFAGVAATAATATGLIFVLP